MLAVEKVKDPFEKASDGSEYDEISYIVMLKAQNRLGKLAVAPLPLVAITMLDVILSSWAATSVR